MGRYWELDVPWFNPYVLTSAPIAFLFVVIAGVSLVLFTAREGSVLQAARKMFVRGGYILCVAAVITVVSWLIFPSEVVVFGILHLIGCATILAIPFVVLRVRGWIPFGFGSVIIAISPLLAYVRGPAFLIPFGVTPMGFATLDYEPLIPWFGVLLVGVALGSVLYAGGVRCRELERFGEMPRAAAPVVFLGRHSLFVYLIHNPVIFAVLFVAGFVSL